MGCEGSEREATEKDQPKHRLLHRLSLPSSPLSDTIASHHILQIRISTSWKGLRWEMMLGWETCLEAFNQGRLGIHDDNLLRRR
jgi:hypothetical protein